MQKLQYFKTISAAIHLFFKIVINLKILENSQEYVYVTLYVYETVKHEVINVDFLRKDLHSVPWGIISPQRHHSLFFCQTPLKFANCPSPHFFRQLLPMLVFHKTLPLKIGFFSEPP